MWASAEARSGWRAAATRLIEQSGTIRESVDLSQLHIFMADEYKVVEKYGFIYIPWNFVAGTLPDRMQRLLSMGGSQDGFAEGRKPPKGEVHKWGPVGPPSSKLACRLKSEPLLHFHSPSCDIDRSDKYRSDKCTQRLTSAGGVLR